MNRLQVGPFIGMLAVLANTPMTILHPTWGGWFMAVHGAAFAGHKAMLDRTL